MGGAEPPHAKAACTCRHGSLFGGNSKVASAVVYPGTQQAHSLVLGVGTVRYDCMRICMIVFICACARARGMRVADAHARTHSLA